MNEDFDPTRMPQGLLDALTEAENAKDNAQAATAADDRASSDLDVATQQKAQTVATLTAATQNVATAKQHVQDQLDAWLG
jgi:hypothetical protein